MRTSLQRALARAAAAPLVVTALVVAAPAASAAAPVCPAGSAIAEFDLAGPNHYRVAVHSPTTTQTVLCLQADTGIQAVVVIKSGLGLAPPTVTETAGTGTCSTPIIDMTSPVALSLSVGVIQSGPAICYGKDGVTTTVRFDSGSITRFPDVDVWLPGGSSLLVGICAPSYLRWILTEDDDYYYEWRFCVSNDLQVF